MIGGTSQDASIAKKLKISLEEYHQSLRNYNAHSEIIGNFREEYYFKNKSDAEKACEWIYSVIIANKLID